MQMQDTMFHQLDNLAKLLVLLEHTKRPQVSPRVTMLMLDTTFQARPKRRKRLVL